MDIMDKATLKQAFQHESDIIIGMGLIGIKEDALETNPVISSLISTEIKSKGSAVVISREDFNEKVEIMNKLHANPDSEINSLENRQDFLKLPLNIKLKGKMRRANTGASFLNDWEDIELLYTSPSISLVKLGSITLPIQHVLGDDISIKV